MATSTLKTRIKHKTGTAAEWQTAATNSQFKPLEGELIVYESATTPMLKVGDGSSLVTALPFVGGNPIVSITRSGLTFTATHADGTTSAFSQQDNNTIYTHPSHTAKSSGLYKITVDNQGHVSAATAVTKADITGLGIPGSASSVTLNGTSTTSASFYAPTSAGTNGYVLKSSGSGAPTWAAEYSYTLPNATSSTLGGVKIGSNITVSSGTISLTKSNVTAALGYTPPTSDTNTTYSAGTGISLSGTTFSNSGVRSISTGSSNGTISVNTNGTSANVAVKGLGSNAYTSTAYLPLAGGTMTGRITGPTTNGSWISTTKQGCLHMGTAASGGSAAAVISMKTSSGSWSLAGLSGSNNLYFVWGSDTNYNNSTNTTASTYITSDAKIYGAVWNDYAEYRSQNETIEPGYITYCDDDGKLKKTVERLQKYEGVVSDTFGFAIGETDDCKTPLAVSGRALVYCDPEEEHFHSGDCVCAGPNGLAYRMTREEIIEFPDRIVGVVSEIPTYETWGTGNVEVNGRIWIRIK